MQQSILVTVFNVESEGYKAITELKKAALNEKSMITEAALVKKTADSCEVLDMWDTGLHTSDDAARGGLIGACMGVIGGPVGVLLGAGYGALVGMSFDNIDAINGASMLEQIADKLDDGTVALVAMTYEEENEEIDAMLAGYDAVVARFDAAVVAEEVMRAREIEAEMARMARMELRKSKEEDFKAKVEARRAELQEKAEKRREELKKNEDILAANFTK